MLNLLSQRHVQTNMRKIKKIRYSRYTLDSKMRRLYHTAIVFVCE